MTGAIRVVSVERGHDPRDLVLVPFGGAGPLHGGALARLLGIKTVLLPPAPGVLSALGAADLKFEDRVLAHLSRTAAALRSRPDRLDLCPARCFAGSHRSDSAVATATALFTAHPTGAGDPALQGLAGIGNLIRREAYVFAYIDGFWIIAWVMAAGIVLLLLLHPPPPNPLTPPRSDL
jgi:hypothetical protein